MRERRRDAAPRVARSQVTTLVIRRFVVADVWFLLLTAALFALLALCVKGAEKL